MVGTEKPQSIPQGSGHGPPAVCSSCLHLRSFQGSVASFPSSGSLCVITGSSDVLASISDGEVIVQNETRDKSRHSSKQTPITGPGASGVEGMGGQSDWGTEATGGPGKAARSWGEGPVPGDKDVGRMVGMERDGGEGRANSSLENGRVWQFKSHGVEGIGIFSPTAQWFWGVQLNPHPSASLGRGSQGLRPSLSGMVRRAAGLRGQGSLCSRWRRRGCGGRVQVAGKPAGCCLPLPG